MRLHLPEYKGSRPPPQNRPRTNGLSIFFVMGLVIAAAFVASGGSTPVDPNGPGGPPTLEPYFKSSDYGQQQIVWTDPQNGKSDKNLQLKTFLVEGCSTKTALYFILDTSGSMQYDNKLQKEKNALNGLIDRLGDKAVVGMTTFSKDVEEQVALGYLDVRRQEVKEAINEMDANGWTRTRDAFLLVQQKIDEAIKFEEFPGYTYSILLMTDGVPEDPNPGQCIVTVPDSNLASGRRCFALSQNPLTPSNIPEELKRENVEIYSINIYSPSYPSDAALYPYLRDLLKEVASPSVDDHYFESIAGNNLDKILNKICDPIANY